MPIVSNQRHGMNLRPKKIKSPQVHSRRTGPPETILYDVSVYKYITVGSCHTMTAARAQVY